MTEEVTYPPKSIEITISSKVQRSGTVTPSSSDGNSNNSITAKTVCKWDDWDCQIIKYTKIIENSKLSNFATEYNARAWAYYMKGDCDKALADVNKAFEESEKFAEANPGRRGEATAYYLDTRARAYLGKGNYKLTLLDVNKAIEKNHLKIGGTKPSRLSTEKWD